MNLINKLKDAFTTSIIPSAMDENIYLRTKQTVKINFKDKTKIVSVYPLSDEQRRFISILEDAKKYPFVLMPHKYREIVMSDDTAREDEDLIYSSFLIN